MPSALCKCVLLLHLTHLVDVFVEQTHKGVVQAKQVQSQICTKHASMQNYYSWCFH